MSEQNPTEAPKKGGAYDPTGVEQRWYQHWEASGAFIAHDRGRQPFAIMIPPPNVTGALHMGHALNNTIQDMVIRMRRMQGFDTLWLPGTDHAGIATQSVVEKDLRKKKSSRHELGRERFIEEVWKWKEEYGNRILTQLKRLGCSCDWSRTRFTLDDGLSHAVRHVFCTLFEDGLIYRGLRIVNWCPTCHSAISDDEVEHRDEDSFLWEIDYPLVEGEGALRVATTRPETLFGDMAVAVHPKDERWNRFIGQEVRLPLTDRTIPVIADEAVELDFGTGCLKITPAHDANDFETGKRHGLEPFCVIATNGTMNENVPEKYRGLDRFKCRDAAIADLKEQGLLHQETPYKHAVGHCYRTDDVIEPYLSEQWFVKMEPLAQPALQAYRDDRLKFVPARYGHIYERWLENVRDWCISRQLWWGHRIPIWTCDNCEHVSAYREDPTECPVCQSKNLTQDPDVLDTWFSSQLWPFSTLGWPENTNDLQKWYPGNLLSTAREIIFFWVARMVMMGEKFKPHTGTIRIDGEEVPTDCPFETVYIHGTVLDNQGRRMSKSLGNGIDPIDLIDKYGCDAVRFSLMMLATEGQDIKLAADRMEMGKHFANKIWNAVRFVYQALDAHPEPEAMPHKFTMREDKWILSQLQTVTGTVTGAIEEYRLREGALALYDFFWNQFCDWYLELIKPRLRAGNEPDADDAAKRSAFEARCVLDHTIHTFLKLLHPYMPHITEELWQIHPSAKHSNYNPPRPLLMLANWPEPNPLWIDLHIEQAFALTMELVRNIRATRAAVNLTDKTLLKVMCSTSSHDVRLELQEMETVIKQSAKLEELTIGENLPRPEQSTSFMLPFGPTVVYIPLAGLVDLEAERAKARKKLEELDKQIAGKNAQLANENFVSRAKPEAVQVIVESRNRLEEQIQLMKEHLSSLG
ncbi:MAG: valine--tRNA ligase [bacterium]|nr:valine--tRNA ligase [bacterium]